MKSFPFDSHVTYKSDGTPIFDRAIDSAVYRGLLKNLFTTGILSIESTNMQVTTNEGMRLSILPGFAMVDGVMNLNDETVDIELDAADGTYARIDSVVLRLNTNDDYRNCEFYVVKGTPSEAPIRPALTREIAIYELGLADIYVASGATSITADNITDTRYEEERCGVMTSGDISRYIDEIQSSLDDIVASLTSENDKKFKFGYKSDLDRYGCNVDDKFLPFGGTKIIIDGQEVTDSISFILKYTWASNAFSQITTYSRGMFSALDGIGKIHAMGDKKGDSSYYSQHYVYDDAWSKLSNLPGAFAGGCALTDENGNVVKISTSYYSTYKYTIGLSKYVDGAWVGGKSIPPEKYVQSQTSEAYAACTKDGNIHLVFMNAGKGPTNVHFVYSKDGVWSEIGTYPGTIGPIVADAEGNIHMFDGSGGSIHYVYDGSSWSSVGTTPGKVTIAMLDSNNVIHLFVGKTHYKYMSGKFINVGALTELEPSNAFVKDGTMTAIATTTSTPYKQSLYNAASILEPVL